jgi:peptide/nickel transport system permease protein
MTQEAFAIDDCGEGSSTGGGTAGGGTAAARDRVRAGFLVVLPYAVTVLVLVTVNFAVPRAMPGDPITTMVASSETAEADAEVAQELRRYYGLDRPVVNQYGTYLVGLVQGDLGTSIRYNAPVAELIAARLPWTLLLIASAMLAATVIGLLAGAHSGWRRGRSVDRRLLLVFLGTRNIPPFVLASLAAFVFAVRLGWAPLGGATTAFGGPTGALGAVDIAHHLALPAGVLAVQFAAGHYLFMRAGMVNQLGASYLLLGRAKGLGERRLKYRHAARNAVLPVVTLTALQLSFAITGSIFVETVFAYPGMGRLVFDAVGFRDYPLLQGCFLVFSLAVVGLNLTTDLLYRRLDPRVRP